MKDLCRFVMCGFLSLGAAVSHATTFYSEDYEEGIKYVGDKKKAPGGGWISFLGGEVVNGIRPGDGTQDFQKYTNVILDSSADAQNSVTGSKNALKTQYKAGGTGWGYAGDFGLNTTIISFPDTPNVYVRWYQKWGKNWVWPADQQKLLKVKGETQSQNFKLSFGKSFINLTKRSPPPNENLNETYVFPNLKDIGEVKSDWRQDDSLTDNKNVPMEKDRWYCIEVMVKSNTPNKNDAEFAYWIDGEQRFYLNNTNNRGASTGGISHIELQHVVQDVWNKVHTVDTPTWMDNIVVADTKIGCVDAAQPDPAQHSNPLPPSGLRIY